MEKKITLNEWLEIHPYNKSVKSDNYYLELANVVFNKWTDSKILFNLNENVRKRISMYIAAYFEDTISKFGLWQAFTAKHKFLYDKWLPLYDSENEYFEDEINVSDVKFILWYSIQQLVGKASHTIFPPFIGGLEELSRQLYEVLDSRYETAPANEFLYHLFENENVYSDVFVLKQYVNWLFAHSYLMEPSTQFKIAENQHFVAEKFKASTDEQKNMIMYGIMQDTIFLYPCGPLALLMKDWLCAIVGKESPCFELYRHIDVKPALNWLVTKMDDSHIYISCLQKDDMMQLDRKMFKDSEKFVPGKTVVTCGFLKYKDVWNINGIISLNDISKFQNIKRQPNIDKLREMHKNVYEKFMSVNENPIAYFDSLDNLKSFLISKMGWPEDSNNSFDALSKSRNFVLFASEDKGLIIATNIAEFISDEHNPMYNPDEAKLKSFFIFVNKGQCPIDLLEYLVENDKLPDAGMIVDTPNSNIEKGKQLLKDNWDFIARMFLNEYYWDDMR